MDCVCWWQRAVRLMRVAPVMFGLAPFLTTAALSAQEATPGAGSACRDAIARDADAQTQRLLADCVTDETIFVANGWTFDGEGHTVFARDPAGGRLQGAVLIVGEGAGDIHDVVIDGSGLEAPCLVDSGTTALAGMLFLNSTGEVRQVAVRDLDRAFSGDATLGAESQQSQRESCGTGLAIEGDGAEVTASGNTFTGLGNTGVLVRGGAATLANNLILRTRDTGVLALFGARVTVGAGNQIRHGYVGIQFEGSGAGGSVAGSSVAEMAFAGIVAMAEADVSLDGTTIEEVNGPGVVAAGRSAITAERVDIQRTARAAIADGGALRLQDATIAECAMGVLTMNGGSAEVSGSTVRACDIGLGAGGAGSRLTASTSTITGSDRAGVMLGGGAAADLTELRITQSGVGLAATDHNLVELVDIHIQDTTQAGISAAGGSQVTLTSSGMRHPGEFGVIVADAGTLLVSRENSITDAVQTGFQVLAGGRLETSDTRIYGGETGIAAGGIGSSAQIAETYISDTETNLLVTDGATVEAFQLFTAGGTTGVTVAGEGARATVRESTINRPQEDGVRVQAAGWVSVETSTITDAGAAAISLQRGAALPAAVELVLDESGCSPRVVPLPAGVLTEITFRNAGQSSGQIESAIGVAFDLAPGDSEVVRLMSVPVDTPLKCYLPGGNGAWEEVILRAIPPDQAPLPAAPVEPHSLRANEIHGGSQGIVVAAGVSATVTGNTIEGVTGDALAIAEGALVDAQDNSIVAATPTAD